MNKVRITVDSQKDFQQVHCDKCGALLFKAKKLTLVKSSNIQIKCRKCKNLIDISL